MKVTHGIFTTSRNNPHGPIGLDGTTGGSIASMLRQVTDFDSGIPLNDAGTETGGIGLGSIPYEDDAFGVTVPG